MESLFDVEITHAALYLLIAWVELGQGKFVLLSFDYLSAAPNLLASGN